MLPVIHLALKIFMAVNYCGCQLSQWLWLVTSAYHIGAALHPGACKFSLQYYDGRIGVCVGTYNLGSLSGKWEKFVEN